MKTNQLIKYWDSVKTGSQEHEQSFLRLGVAFGLTAYFGILNYLYGAQSVSTSTLTIAGIAIAWSMMWVVIAIRNIESNLDRQLIGFAGDVTFVSVLISITGEYGTPLFFLFLIMLVGAVMDRRKHIFWGTYICALTSLLISVAFSNYWNARMEIIAAILGNLVFIPLYIRQLRLRSFEDINRTEVKFIQEAGINSNAYRGKNILSLVDHMNAKQKGVKILLAEDSAVARKIYMKILVSGGGHIVDDVQDGITAMDKLSKNKYDIVILNLKLPFISGMEIVNARKPIDRTPIIVVTSDSSVESIRACHQAGVDAYLVKPVDAEKLLNTVASLSNISLKRMKPTYQLGEKDGDLIDKKTIDTLKIIGAGQPGFLHEITSEYVYENTLLLTEMMRMLDEKDTSLLSKRAHIGKGSSGNIGAKMLCLLFSEMMQFSDQEWIDTGSAKINAALECLQETRLVMEHLIAHSTSYASSTPALRQEGG